MVSLLVGTWQKITLLVLLTDYLIFMEFMHASHGEGLVPIAINAKGAHSLPIRLAIRTFYIIGRQ